MTYIISSAPKTTYSPTAAEENPTALPPAPQTQGKQSWGQHPKGRGGVMSPALCRTASFVPSAGLGAGSTTQAAIRDGEGGGSPLGLGTAAGTAPGVRGLYLHTAIYI